MIMEALARKVDSKYIGVKLIEKVSSLIKDAISDELWLKAFLNRDNKTQAKRHNAILYDVEDAIKPNFDSKISKAVSEFLSKTEPGYTLTLPFHKKKIIGINQKALKEISYNKGFDPELAKKFIFSHELDEARSMNLAGRGHIFSSLYGQKKHSLRNGSASHADPIVMEKELRRMKKLKNIDPSLYNTFGSLRKFELERGRYNDKFTTISPASKRWGDVRKKLEEIVASGPVKAEKVRDFDKRLKALKVPDSIARPSSPAPSKWVPKRWVNEFKVPEIAASRAARAAIAATLGLGLLYSLMKRHEDKN